MNGAYELFKIKGLPVKLHRGFGLLALFYSILVLAEGGESTQIVLNLLILPVLLLTLLIHELGHAFCARALGYPVLDVLLTPLMSMARIADRLNKPEDELKIALAGPAANLAVAILLAITLNIVEPGQSLSFSSLFKSSFAEQGLLRTALFFNLALGLVNLLPAFPSDGGRILRALLAFKFGRLVATRLAFRVSLWFAITLILMPFFVDQIHWLITPMIGIVIIVAGLKERFTVELQESGLGGLGGNSRFKFFKMGNAGPFAQSGENPFHVDPEASTQDQMHDSGDSIHDDGIIDVQAEVIDPERKRLE